MRRQPGDVSPGHQLASEAEQLRVEEIFQAGAAIDEIAAPDRPGVERQVSGDAGPAMGIIAQVGFDAASGKELLGIHLPGQQHQLHVPAAGQAVDGADDVAAGPGIAHRTINNHQYFHEFHLIAYCFWICSSYNNNTAFIMERKKQA